MEDSSWFWKKGQITVHALQGDHYEPVPTSAVLPGIDLPVLLPFVDMFPMTSAVRAYRDALRRQSATLPNETQCCWSGRERP